MRAQTKANGGAIENRTGLIRDVVFWDFENSFRASARGRRSAISEALLGPLRSWAYPSPRRSRRVKRAMARRPKIRDRRRLMTDIINKFIAILKILFKSKF